MKFVWKFKKVIEEQIFKMFIKFGENLLKTSWLLTQKYGNLTQKKWKKQCKLLISENYK